MWWSKLFSHNLQWIGIPGNLLTCFIITTNSYMRTPPNFFLLNLAITDLLTLSSKSYYFKYIFMCFHSIINQSVKILRSKSLIFHMNFSDSNWNPSILEALSMAFRSFRLCNSIDSKRIGYICIDWNNDLLYDGKVRKYHKNSDRNCFCFEAANFWPFNLTSLTLYLQRSDNDFFQLLPHYIWLNISLKS